MGRELKPALLCLLRALKLPQSRFSFANGRVGFGGGGGGGGERDEGGGVKERRGGGGGGGAGGWVGGEGKRLGDGGETHGVV